MAYSDFDLRAVRERFDLTLREDLDLFAATPAVEVGRFLKLEGAAVVIDRPEYDFSQLDKILGILLTIAT